MNSRKIFGQAKRKKFRKSSEHWQFKENIDHKRFYKTMLINTYFLYSTTSLSILFIILLFLYILKNPKELSRN